MRVGAGSGSEAVIRIYGSAEPKGILTVPQHCYKMIFSTRTRQSGGFATGRAKRNLLYAIRSFRPFRYHNFIYNSIFPLLYIQQY
jgi:hypothetical protein